MFKSIIPYSIPCLPVSYLHWVLINVTLIDFIDILFDRPHQKRSLFAAVTCVSIWRYVSISYTSLENYSFTHYSFQSSSFFCPTQGFCNLQSIPKAESCHHHPLELGWIMYSVQIMCSFIVCGKLQQGLLMA